MSRHEGRIVGLFKASALCLIVGCSASANERGQGPGPSLALLDSVILEENDTLYLGRPAVSFTVDDRGAIYIPDEFWNRVVRFHPDGRIDRTIGKEGSGPGEFRSLSQGTTLADTLILQPTSRTIQIFDRRTGRYYMGRRTQGTISHGVARGGKVIFANFDYYSQRGILALSVPELLTPDSARLAEPLASNLVPWPQEYIDYPDLMTFNRSAFAAWADTMLVGYSGVDYLTLHTIDGVPLDTVQIPARLRTGNPKEAFKVFSFRNPDLDEQMRAISALKDIWRLPNGTFVLWFQDGWTEPMGTGVHVFGRAFISLLSADRRSACVDTPLPFPGTEWPRIAVHGDTLFALDQVPLLDDSSRVTSVIRRYLIDDTGCEWVPTG